MARIRKLSDVVDAHLCIGCGACYYACERGGVRLENVIGEGIRPVFEAADCASCTACLEVCPGYTIDATLEVGRPDPAPAGSDEFGPALEIWEGWATDPEIRASASSGGVVTALSLYCLEREGMEQVVHAAMDEEKPWLNKTTTSRSRDELARRTGSRYATSSPCEGLGWVEEAERPSVFVGKPCDAAAAAKLRATRPELADKLGLILTFFCAGTPSTRGTLELIAAQGGDETRAEEVRYRGHGWPGHFRVREKGETSVEMTYDDSWAFLTRYRPLRCNLCPDGLGRVSDIACGDAWHAHDPDADDPGRSLVLVRTERGRKILQGAVAAGYVQLQPATADDVVEAQRNLLGRRRQLYGRLLGMKLLTMPTPRFVNFDLKRSWSKLGAKQKLKSILGTTRRMIKRGYWKRRPRN